MPAQDNNTSNVAYQDEHTRFTIISDGTIRMEWQKDGKFVNSPSFVAVERNYAPAEFQVHDSDGWIEITTSKFTLKYKKDSGKFTASNLAIDSKNITPSFHWKPGDTNAGNLKGTFRTLDGYDGDIFVGNGNDNGDHKPMPIEDGILSTDGWTLIDDSKGLLFDDSEWAWVTERPSGEGQDWYFMAYGHNYKKALKDFTTFAGKVPLPPRYAFGYWWSRYWSYSDDELRDLTAKFDAYDIPLDVLVIDMDWHYVNPGRGGWTGYTWNRSLFPNPAQFLQYLKGKKLQVTLNLHPPAGLPRRPAPARPAHHTERPPARRRARVRGRLPRSRQARRHRPGHRGERGIRPHQPGLRGRLFRHAPPHGGRRCRLLVAGLAAGYVRQTYKDTEQYMVA